MAKTKSSTKKDWHFTDFILQQQKKKQRKYKFCYTREIKYVSNKIEIFIIVTHKLLYHSAKLLRLDLCTNILFHFWVNETSQFHVIAEPLNFSYILYLISGKCPKKLQSVTQSH